MPTRRSPSAGPPPGAERRNANGDDLFPTGPRPKYWLALLQLLLGLLLLYSAMHDTSAPSSTQDTSLLP